MLTAIAALALNPYGLGSQLTRTVDQPVPGGQRELVLGLQEHPRTAMIVVYVKQNAPIFGPDNIVGADSVEATLGYTRWSVSIGSLVGKQCRILKSEAFTTQSGGVNTDDAGAKQDDTWWVDPDGKIIRHFRKRTDRDGTVEADCAYREDRIDVTRRRPKAADERVSFVPTVPMQKLHDRFLPLVEGDKVTESKQFVEFDPLKGEFLTFKLTRGGRFASGKDTDTRGPQGYYYDLKGPGVEERIFLRPDGSVARIELPRNRAIIPAGGTRG